MSRLIYAEYLLYLIKDIDDGERFGYIDAEDINNAPTVDAVPVVHGHWIASDPRTTDAFWVCSCCGFPSEAHGAFKLYKYCPQCGTLMDEVTE